MSKPDDIPQDVWDDAARAFYATGTHDLPSPIMEYDIQVIAAVAILAERERCANIAANWRESQPPMVVPSKQYRLHDVADEIAHAIRNPSPTADPPRAANISPAALGAASNSNFKRVQVLGPVR
jgi:hypothetical protein